MTDKILTEIDGRVAIVSLNHAERRNAQTPEMRRVVGEVLAQLMGDAQVNAIILTGVGGHFSAGADINHMKDVSVMEGRAVIETADRAIRTIINGPKPVIAAVEGIAAGAGLSLAIACDVVVATAQTKFAASFINVGLMPDMGALWTLPQRVGHRRARQIFLNGEVLAGAEAAEAGLADHLVEPGQSLTRALEIAHRFAQMAPMALALTKAALANGCPRLEDAFRAEVDYQPVLRCSQDHKEAVAAFLEKREPVFRGN